MKYFDKKNNRLVFENVKASAEFWDVHWNVADFKNSILSGKNDRFVSKYTKKYIPPNRSKKILEGGCGKGNFVYSLYHQGYDAYGIDYAEETIKKINGSLPDLKISYGDVRNISYPDDFFDGYWSLGVIEHFFEGYDKIIDEASRIIKKDGLFFVTFPNLSPLRKLKAFFSCYPKFNEETFNQELFYQFALDSKSVQQAMEKRGFSLVFRKPFDGTKGLKDEISFLKPLLQKVYGSKNIICRIISYAISMISSFFAGHAILLIFKKND